MTWRVVEGDALERLRQLQDQSVQTCVTSPPYFGLRDYGTGEWAGGDAGCDHSRHVDYGEKSDTNRGSIRGGPMGQECDKCGATRTDSQVGLEATSDEYVARLVEVFREVRRVLRDDGTLWLNLGDSYNAYNGNRGPSPGFSAAADEARNEPERGLTYSGCKPKDLLGIPWSVAEALRDPYYTGRIAAERDRVWMAATLDAEGTISGFNHERADGNGVRTGVNLCITNTSDALLAEAGRIWPASRSEHMSRDGALGNKPCWRWLVHGIENKTEFLREVYPHLIVKRKQAVLAYNLLVLMADAKRLGHSSQRDAVREKRALLVRLMSQANKTDCDVPSWCAEPPSMFEPGWYLRSDIIWAKPNPMPESVTDRPTKSHEYVFLLSKSKSYFYDADAIREDHSPATGGWKSYQPRGLVVHGDAETSQTDSRAGVGANPAGRNKRSVWTVATQPFPGAHFAVFPPKLIEPCVKAGSAEDACGVCGAPWERVVEHVPAAVAEMRPKDARKFLGASPSSTLGTSNSHDGAVRNGTNRTMGFKPSCDHQDKTGSSVVLDPFSGAGTTGLVATRLGRSFIGIELNPVYAEMSRERIRDDQPLFNWQSEAAVGAAEGGGG